MKLLDLTGQTYGRLTVLRNAPKRKGRIAWECKCSCGRIVAVTTHDLRDSRNVSCGCYHREFLANGGPNKTHGLSGTPIYAIWKSMKARCSRQTDKLYPYYGGRGIRVSERWIGPNGLVNFVADVGRRPGPSHSLERIDNSGHYEPGNVRWATDTEQARNRRSNRLITFRGETLCATEWADRTGIHNRTIRARLDRLCWPVDRALTTPIAKG